MTARAPLAVLFHELLHCYKAREQQQALHMNAGISQHLFSMLGKPWAVATDGPLAPDEYTGRIAELAALSMLKLSSFGLEAQECLRAHLCKRLGCYLQLFAGQLHQAPVMAAMQLIASGVVQCKVESESQSGGDKLLRLAACQAARSLPLMVAVLEGLLGLMREAGAATLLGEVLLAASKGISDAFMLVELAEAKGLGHICSPQDRLCQLANPCDPQLLVAFLQLELLRDALSGSGSNWEGSSPHILSAVLQSGGSFGLQLASALVSSNQGRGSAPVGANSNSHHRPPPVILSLCSLVSLIHASLQAAALHEEGRSADSSEGAAIVQAVDGFVTASLLQSWYEPAETADGSCCSNIALLWGLVREAGSPGGSVSLHLAARKAADLLSCVIQLPLTSQQPAIAAVFLGAGVLQGTVQGLHARLRLSAAGIPAPARHPSPFLLDLGKALQACSAVLLGSVQPEVKASIQQDLAELHSLLEASDKATEKFEQVEQQLQPAQAASGGVAASDLDFKDFGIISGSVSTSGNRSGKVPTVEAPDEHPAAVPGKTYGVRAGSTPSSTTKGQISAAGKHTGAPASQQAELQDTPAITPTSESHGQAGKQPPPPGRSASAADGSEVSKQRTLLQVQQEIARLKELARRKKETKRAATQGGSLTESAEFAADGTAALQHGSQEQLMDTRADAAVGPQQVGLAKPAKPAADAALDSWHSRQGELAHLSAMSVHDPQSNQQAVSAGLLPNTVAAQVGSPVEVQGVKSLQSPAFAAEDMVSGADVEMEDVQDVQAGAQAGSTVELLWAVEGTVDLDASNIGQADVEMVDVQ